MNVDQVNAALVAGALDTRAGLAVGRAKALFAAGFLAINQGDFEDAETLLKESEARYRTLAHEQGIASALNCLATIEELRQRKTITFKFYRDGIQHDGFLAWFDEQVLAYENRCRHIPISLDYGDGRFFTPDGSSIICQSHGATYEPLTGKCIAGPCPGTYLTKLPIQVVNGQISLEENENLKT